MGEMVGHLDRAEEVARAITDPNGQAQALARVAEAAAVRVIGTGPGSCRAGRGAARAITDPYGQAQALADVAEAAAAAGDLDRAEAVPGRSPTRTGRREPWPTWPAAAAAGDLDRAGR